MNRIVLMLLRNLVRFPWAYAKLSYYAKHSEKYSEEVKYRHIRYIFQRAVKSGNIDLQIYGKENIPEENGFMLYANHQGMFDIVAVVAACERPMAAVLKKELCKVKFLKHIVDCTNSYPLERDNVKQSLGVIQAVTKDVKDGRNCLIFPEGTRSRDGNNMLEFHGGSFRCAVKAKCPILPIALIDTYKVLDHKGSKKVTVQLHYLKPVYYEEYKDLNTVELAELVRSRIEEVVKKHAPDNE